MVLRLGQTPTHRLAGRGRRGTPRSWGSGGRCRSAGSRSTTNLTSGGKEARNVGVAAPGLLAAEDAKTHAGAAPLRLAPGSDDHRGLLHGAVLTPAGAGEVDPPWPWRFSVIQTSTPSSTRQRAQVADRVGQNADELRVRVADAALLLPVAAGWIGLEEALAGELLQVEDDGHGLIARRGPRVTMGSAPPARAWRAPPRRASP